VALLHSCLAPQSLANLCLFQEVAAKCRLGAAEKAVLRIPDPSVFLALLDPDPDSL
jgi:hypothetical protein